jgi:interferon-induced GTP-binding protein Mx1
MSINESFADDVVPWLKLAEELQSLNLESELNVPQICVMGDQSSGKSSVSLNTNDLKKKS